MQNMMVFEDGHIQTETGIFGGVSSYQVYDTGQLKSVMLNDKNMVVTHVGELVPYYTENERRKDKPAVEFFKNGMIKAVSLEEQTEVETPIGEFPAELVTFYDTGELHRIFPRDGKISGFWTEENESELEIPFTFDLDFTKFTAKLSSVCFYKSGEIRSITLFPGETIKVHTPYGEIGVRNGFSLFESGALKSFEPALPAFIRTPIGTIMAYDPEADGITADVNSVNLNEDGTIESLITVNNKVLVQTDDERMLDFSPQILPAITEEDDERVAGLHITFSKTGIKFNDEDKEYTFEMNGFNVMPFRDGVPTCNPADCASCSICH